MHPVFYYIAGLFFIGSLGTMISSRSLPAGEKQSRWLKLIIYFFIVVFFTAVILWSPLLLEISAILIVATGCFEIVRVTKRVNSFFFLSFSIYLLLSAGFIYMIFLFPAGKILFIYFIVFTFDGFSQVCGQLFGKHKLVPQISPGKTVEGLLGGIVFAIAFLPVAGTWAGFSTSFSFLYGLLLLPAAFAGDIYASYFKRRNSVKDFSNLIPGHGGVLDRFDSWICAGGVAGIVYFFFP